MHYRKLYNSDYIGSYDLDGKDTVLTIEAVNKTPVFNPSTQQDEEKAVVTFKEAKKAWIMNRTNGDAIASLYGEDTDNWIGKQITLTTAKVKAFGKVQDAIRVKLPEGKLNK